VIGMPVELRARSQIIIPAGNHKKTGFEGDKFEVIEKDGVIFFCPVVVYPKAKLEEIAKKMKETVESSEFKEYDCHSG
jgi:antitoxin MazE